MIGDTYKQIEIIQLKYKYIEDTIQTYICIYTCIYRNMFLYNNTFWSAAVNNNL